MVTTRSSLLSSLSGLFNLAPDSTDEQPIREELFSVERLEQHARALAAEHKTVKTRGRSLLLPRLEDNGRKLLQSYRTLVDAIRKGRPISPAAEWLIDNFHIVEEQLREIREDLPKSYYHELPKLASGDLKGYPRIYALGVALTAHTDSRLETNTLQRFITGYQSVTPLTIGELWAVAISLRLTLVENLRRLAVRIVSARDERDQADRLADRIIELAARQPSTLLPLVIDNLGKREKLPHALVVQLTQRLREQDPIVIPILEWLEKRLRIQGLSIEQITHQEHQRQAAMQVTVGNIITSMRLLSTLDWRDFFERVSLVDPLLGQDPVGCYLNMEFSTRDRYRHVIERISKRTGAGELEIAGAAVKEAAQALQQKGFKAYESHVGFYLVGAGRSQLEHAFRYKPALKERIRRWCLAHPSLTYLGPVMLLTSLILFLLLITMQLAGAGWHLMILAALLGLIPASDLAVSITNWDVTNFFEPRLLPRMKTLDGIPPEARTMVVVPTIFSRESDVHELLEKLEIHFLANKDEHIYFALLTDFPDAASEDTADDASLLSVALDGIEKLNAQYPDFGPRRFHLFHRRRKWNPREGKWMGWERKRGKLHEFNQLLRGSHDTSFIVQTADKKLLAGVRYVITLDSDTQLPRDVARKLVGTAIHPLNRPWIDPAVNRVTAGYGILQPRVSISLESASRSRFAQIFSGNTGIDPYTTAVSDVYQDLFGEGTYTGKGLYDVDAFEAVLATRVPENALLSHDLFESLYARAALVTDIELLDEYPAHYDAYSKRQHRWTRGDWQIFRWLLPQVKDSRLRKVQNTLPVIARWKILDNLRRSLLAPTLLLWLIAAWIVFPGSPLRWTIFGILTISFPVYLHVTNSLLLHPRGIPWTSHFWNVWGDIRTNTAQVLLSLLFLAHQAYLMTDSICRTVFRKLISRKNLLEWTTAAQAESQARRTLSASFRAMLGAEVTGFAVLAAILLLRPDSITIAAPFIVAWTLSPVVAHWISSPTRVLIPELGAADLQFAHMIVRRTWRFFETFVGEEDNWLPPDNFQEDPTPLLAHRTSPTNIGLLLISTASAHDFGYVGTLEFVERQELTFKALGKLQKFHGHFFNWYDTRNLQPLIPQYISTVDSGNLTGHLIALQHVFVDLPERKLFDERVLAGLRDTIDAVRAEAGRLAAIRQRTEVVTVRQLRDEIEAFGKLVSVDPGPNASSWSSLFDSLALNASVIQDIVDALAHEHGKETFAELRWWITALRRQVEAFARDLKELMPWTNDLRHAEVALTEFGHEDVAEIIALLSPVPTLAEIPHMAEAAVEKLAALQQLISATPPTDQRRNRALSALVGLQLAIENGTAGRQLLVRLASLANTCETIVTETDFNFLLDPERKLFIIGYNVTELRPDNSFYDLLASEARLASFTAIAKGDVPQEHWFRLGRQLIAANGGRALISWTGTMFEYLMPLLVMRDYPNTLLHQTYMSVVNKQIEYGEERGVPWGISESAYNIRDLHFNYQYGPFGVAGLGLKRGLIEDLVVAPYATMLAAMIKPHAAIENLRRLEEEGALGTFGFYESIDYTPERLPQNQKLVLIRAFMTHHQGMSLVSLHNLIHRWRMVDLFHSDPSVQATQLLLQERIPIGVPAVHPRAEEVLTGRVSQPLPGTTSRIYTSADRDTPRTQLLSNGTYSVMVTTAGSGYSLCEPNAVTRWREDVTRDHWGTFIYLRDVRSGAVWSAGVQPVERKPQTYEVAFGEDKVDIWRTDAGIVTHLEIVVSAEDNAEVRRVSLTNNTTRTREIEVTSYAEVVLAPPQADAAHPAFSNLFIETEFLPSANALLARRRQRSSSDAPIWGVHVAMTTDEALGSVQYETDRGRFLGRGHSPADPVAIMEDRPLSNTVGAVLDPVFSLRRRVRIRPNETVRVTFATGVARSREEAVMLADTYHDPGIFEREARLAWTKAQVEMSHLAIDVESAHLFQRLASRIIYSDPSLRPRPHVLALNTRAQSSLWPYAISGDLPILLVRINRPEDLPTVRKSLRGHEYLRYKGLKIDLVILNDHPTTYIQSLQHELESMVRTSGLQNMQDRPGGIFL
ncbi:MAG TPA: glucoamylase family protein, partial [Pyrinomonadaceae bacterium]